MVGDSRAAVRAVARCRHIGCARGEVFGAVATALIVENVHDAHGWWRSGSRSVWGRAQDGSACGGGSGAGTDGSETGVRRQKCLSMLSRADQALH